MDMQSFFTYLILIVFVGAWWNNFNLRNKALCIYTRSSGQEVKKFVTLKDNCVIFDGLYFEITPDRARDVWYDEGLFGKVFPTWIKCFHFNSADYLPENFKQHGIQWENAANRKRINARNDMQVFVETQTPQAEVKKGKFAKYLPLIIGIVVLIVGWYVYSYMQNTNAHLDYIDKMLPK